MQLGVNANEAKVLKAHAAPLELCDNLINALKLLANQQKDGDSPIQSIVTGLHERSRKGIMEKLRSFIKEDNHCALDVGRLSKGKRPFKVQKPNFSEDYPEAAIREGADELTLRIEEVGTILTTWRTTDGGRRWLMRTGMLSAKQFTKDLKVKNGKSCTVTTEK